MQLDTRRQSTRVLLHGSPRLHVCVWHTCPPKDNRDGNDAGSSPSLFILYVGLFILRLFTYVYT